MGFAFRATGLEKKYARIRALAGVDLHVEEGELFGLLGPNGAGKSTLVKIACGLVRPTAGAVEIFGHQPRSISARRALGYLAELFRFPGWLSAGEVLMLHQQLMGSDGDGKERSELLELVGLAEVEHRRIERMSKGMQQRLGIAQALVGAPRLLVLDEPTSALDPEGRHVVRRLLEELRGRGTAVLLNSHLLSEVELVCDRVGILSEGAIVAEGTSDELTGPAGIEIETDSGIRRYPDAARDDIPGLVEALVEEGARIYAVHSARRGLEEAYLDAVRGRME